MIVTRFPPSPTGYVHIGSLRTVLYNYLYAKKESGKMILRIEDTDRTRLVEGSVENMLFVLASVGLIPDEGPNNPGIKGPYFQSERLGIYNDHMKVLLEKEQGYYCFCSSERLDELRTEQELLGLPTKYDGKCRYLSKEEVKNELDKKGPYTIRLKVPKGRSVVFDDVIRGRIEIHTKDVDDQVLMKSDGYPTYHFANVVDDHLMEVTHVIRGEEWVPSTPKHVLLYEAFGWKCPTFAHLPLLLGKDKKKLSKRMGDVSVESYLTAGYPTEALLNYIALLGWNPKTTEEFFTMDQLIEKFDLSSVHKSGAVFDIERLSFFSAKYITNYPNAVLYDKLEMYLSRYDREFHTRFHAQDKAYTLKIIGETKGRMKKYSDYKELTRFFYDDPVIDSNIYINEKMGLLDIQIVKKFLQFGLGLVQSAKHDFQTLEDIKSYFVQKISEAGHKNGQVLWPIRVALTGESFSPGALELLLVFGKEESIRRLEKAISRL